MRAKTHQGIGAVLRNAARLLVASVASMAMPAMGAGLELTTAPMDWPDTMRLTVVSDMMRVNGVNTRVIAFESPQSADELAAHFGLQWPGTMKRAKAGPWEVLSHRDGDLLIAVQVAAAALGGTRGFVSYSNIFEVIDRGGSSASVDVPMLPGTRVHQLIDSDDSGVRSRTTVLVGSLSPTQQLDFYREHYRSQGFEPIGSDALSRNENGGVMVLNRGATQANISVAARDGQTIVTIVTVSP